MRKILSLVTVMLLTALVATAQTREITGRVTDDQNQPVAGASVQVRGGTTGTAADANGNFRISVKTGDVLVISATNFATREVTITNQTTVNVSLASQVAVIDEVVVTALGIARQSKELGYSTAKVKSAELTQGSPVNIQNGLTAKVSGLTVNTTNNGVFAQTRLTLRGIRSLSGNNQPMLIVDGVPMPLGFLSSINPNDVENVTVLKSAQGTAVYGPEGVNGALVVTTKRGVKGRPVVSVSHSTQFESISYMPKFQTRYGSGYAPDAMGYGTFEPIEQQSWGDEFDGSIRQMGQDGPNGEKLMLPYSNVKNGRRNFFNTGVTNQTDVSYSAGDFYISAQNVDINGVMPGDENHRRSFTLKADREYGKFKAGFNLRYTNGQYNVTTNNTIVYYTVTGSPGQYDLSMFKDWRNDYFSSPDGYFTPYLDNNGKTPYFAKDNYREVGTSHDLFGNGELNFKATSWLNLTYRVGISLSNGDSRRTRGAFDYSAYHKTLRDHGALNITSAVTSDNTVSNRINSEIFANFTKRFDKIGLGLLIGQQYRQATSKFLSIGSNNLGTSTLLSVQMRKGEPTVSVDNAKTASERYFAKLSFDYDNWAFLEATGAYDISSLMVKPGTDFEKKDIAYFYPGVSASVLLHEVLPFVQNSKAISYLKLRGTLSKTGNVNIGAYAFEDVFGLSTFFPYGDILGFNPSSTTTSINLTPEFVNSREVGIEMGFLKNRINFEATYYNQNNTDQILSLQQSNTTGVTTVVQNAAAFINKGIELDLRLTPLVKLGQVDVDFSANYSHQNSEVTKIVEGLDELGIGNFNYAIVGQPAYVFKLTDYVRDPQGRVIVDANTGMPTQNPNLTMFGRTSPEHYLGLNLGVNWKGLSFRMVWDYRGGGQMVADQLGGMMDDNGISARSAQNGRRAFIFPNSVYDDGTGKYVENTNVYTQTYGRLFWNSDLNTSVTTNYLASANFWKLRELSITYDIPARVLGSRLSSVVKGLSVGVNGRNLLMFVHDSNQWTDPEYSANGNSAYTGNATGRSTSYNMPPTRLFGFNVAVRF